MAIATELEVLADVVRRLEAESIDYMLTGSLAMSYFAQPRMTRDIDLVVALSAADAERFRRLFEPDYYVPANLAQAIAEVGMFNVLHMQSVVKVDLIVRKDTPYRRTEFGRRLRVNLVGFQAWIVSREDLVLSKLLWAKPTHSEQQLRDVRNLLTTDPDWAYLDAWAKALQVAELLEECRR